MKVSAMQYHYALLTVVCWGTYRFACTGFRQHGACEVASWLSLVGLAYFLTADRPLDHFEDQGRKRAFWTHLTRPRLGR